MAGGAAPATPTPSPPKGASSFISGQIGWDPVTLMLADGGLVGQTRQALANIVTVLAAAGAEPAQLVRLTWFVTDRDAYLSERKAIGAVYRDVIGRYFPAMSVIFVSSLVEPGAVVEIEATAVIPASTIAVTSTGAQPPSLPSCAYCPSFVSFRWPPLPPLLAQGPRDDDPAPNATAPAVAKRALKATDIFRVRDVRDPQISPDGKWVAYTVTVADSARDKNDTDVWMASWDGKENLRITSTRMARASRAGALTDATSRSSRRATAARAVRSGCSIAEAARRRA